MSDAATKSEVAADGDGTDQAGTEVRTPAGPVASNPVSPKAGKGDDGPAEPKSDSEAETVVLPGKDDVTASPRRKAIKHEGNDKPSKRVLESTSDKKKGTPDRDGDSRSRKVSKEHNHTATSSNLSSTRSSPVPEPRTSSRAGSESIQSKSKGHADSDSVSRASLSRKRKMASEETDEKSHKRRQKRDGSLENSAGPKATDGDRRDKNKSSAARSESPQPRTRNRAQSIKGSTTNPTQRRKKPPPLSVASRSKNNEDESGSDGSASPRGGPHLRRLVSGEATATSPAKLPPHKKLLDRNGRTWLARACDSEDAQIVRDRLQERPEDIDVADYAQNTPLQIASLKGRHEIVKVLLDAGCKLDVKNIDQDTPLIDAVENGHLKVIKLLLAAGVNPRQSNAEGEDVMDLLDTEADDYEDIKKLLTKARESRRRTSDDPQAPNTGKESNHTHSPREASLNSPPPLPTGGRRRTARSEATRNDLLWVNATSQNLQNKARVGDDAAVDHILNMNPGCADIYSVLAATKGSHEVSLSLILAIGRPPADPDPIPGERGSASTPMLAAIGRGNLRVIELLLEQPGFDPTRRLYQNKPYHEISKDRRGPQWDEEYRALKRAYDKAKGRTSNSSPSAAKKSKTEGAGSPGKERTKSQSEAKDATKDVAVRKKPSIDGKSSQPRTDEKSPERSRQHTKKHLRVPSKPSSREASVAVSDREASPLRKSGEKKSRRSLSDTEDTEVQKPRKRLVSRRDLTEGDRQRRESMASVGSASSKDDSKARLAREQSGSQKVKREDSRLESKSNKLEVGKKRSRPDTASPDDKLRESQTSPDAAKKAKRLRVDADGKPKKRTEGDGHTSRHKSPGKETVTSVTSVGKVKDSAKSFKDLKAASRGASPAPSAMADKPGATKIKQEEPDDPSSQLQKEAQEAAEAEKKDKAAKKEAERTARDEAEAKEAESRKREEAERKQKAEKEEAERKAKAEKDEAERKAKAEKEEAERKAKAEKEEADRKAREEEARAEKKRQEEEQARKAAERERLRKEQEELQVRRRKEQEEKERLAREKKQQEEERRRRELLPNALRIAAELGPEQAKQPSEVRYWLPLYTAEGHQLESNSDDASKRELWVTNIQAAPVLGVTDLDLSQYTAWSKRSANDSQRLSLWRILRRKLARYQAPEEGPADHQEEFRLDAEAHEKFDALKSVFWIRLSDLLDIVPRYPHLAGIDLKCCPIAIRPGLKVEPGAQLSPTSVPNGHSGRSSLPNGYH